MSPYWPSELLLTLQNPEPSIPFYEALPDYHCKADSPQPLSPSLSLFLSPQWHLITDPHIWPPTQLWSSLGLTVFSAPESRCVSKSLWRDGAPECLRQLGICLWLGSWSQGPGIQSCIGLPAWRGTCFSLSVCLLLWLCSLSLCQLNKKQNL